MAGFTNGKDVEHEFALELQEHQYGIRSFTTPKVLRGQQHALQVESQLTLLDDVVVQVELDKRGYTMTSTSAAHLATYLNQPFEALTSLLLAISPEFQQAMHKNLQSKLAALARSQGEPSASDPSN
ncbi:hypothetical protein IWW36_001522 [Coemansia brasiliensis]|uniref:GSKIP domain-containing protein n=1 Tax=Coemansia brasiliensis TaxID=2650707 RepID=A0A9W8IF84_9FUNG|nr:hypothetical protein IWW36_001522 [Coemansia brasiliensis]